MCNRIIRQTDEEAKQKIKDESISHKKRSWSERNRWIRKRYYNIKDK